MRKEENEKSVGSSDDAAPNKGTPKNPQSIFISTLFSDEDEETYITLLKEYIDVFALTYKEMTGLDPKVVVHRLEVKKGCHPIKQAQRHFRLELIPLIEVEVNKLLEADFIREVKYPTWISIIMLVPKDEELITFQTSKGIYYYKVMPLGLKNAGATYQRAIQTIFDDMLHKMVECYVDDLVVNSKFHTNHLVHLRQVFDRLQKFQLKMNHLKCDFGVAAGKFLGFTVHT
nr:Transposon Ty3-G Gag-Pol polyprotein [Ipomoea batatas]